MSPACGWFPMERDEIVAWVESHKEVLLADVATISQYPMPFRKVIVQMITPDKRLAIWQEHLEIVAATDDDLSREQKAFVLEARSALPAAFKSEEAKNRLNSRTAELFTRQQCIRVLETLGTQEPPDGLPVPADAQPRSVSS